MALTLSSVEILLEMVNNNVLVIEGVPESPNVIFFKPVVDVNIVRIDRVGVKVLTLDIVPVEDFIVVVHRDDCGGANYVLFLWEEGLKSFEGVGLVKRDIIPVMVLMGVVLDRLVHTSEWLVDVLVIELTRKQVVDGNRDGLVVLNSLASVFVLRREVACSWSKALSKTVLVDSPHLIHFLGHLLTGKLACHKSWAESPQKDIPRIQLEHRCDKIRRRMTYGIYRRGAPAR